MVAVRKRSWVQDDIINQIGADGIELMACQCHPKHSLRAQMYHHHSGPKYKVREPYHYQRIKQVTNSLQGGTIPG